MERRSRWARTRGKITTLIPGVQNRRMLKVQMWLYRGIRGYVPRPSRWTRITGKITALISRVLNRRTSNMHISLYRRTGGRVGGKVGPMSVLLLTTTGRKSGQPRTVPLNFFDPYFEIGSYAVIASNSGRDQPPMWWLNLQANPKAKVEVGESITQVIARQASTEEQ